MILSCIFCVNLQIKSLFISWRKHELMNFASDKASFYKIQTRYKLKTLPKRFLVRYFSC